MEKKNVCLNWGCSSVGKSEAMGSIAAQHSPGIVVHVYNPSTREMQAGESGLEGCLWLHNKFEAECMFFSVSEALK